MTSVLLNKVLGAAGPDEAWFEGLLRWVLGGSPAGAPASPRDRRLAELRHLLETHADGPAWRGRIQAVWQHTSAVSLLADAGLPRHTAFVREALEHFADRVAPRLAPESDLAALVVRLDLDARDADWLESLDSGPWRELLALPAEAPGDALQLLAYRTAALGLARDLLGLGPQERELDSPFARLPQAVEALRQGADPGLALLLKVCQDRRRAALAHLETHGISTDLVFRLDLLEAQLARMGQLLDLLQGALPGQAFAAGLIRQQARARSLRAMVAGSLRLMARKVVEHTGQTGEHYIARSRAEWLGTLGSAAGGGILTAFTALGKYALAGAALAPLAAGLAFSGNYAVSFVAMQLAGYTLASKQPAMTAASLAAALEEGHPRADLLPLVAGITRAQVAATLGNLLATLPATLVLALLWRMATGQPWVGPEVARHSLHGLDPFRSLTIPFAVLTGVMLWLASLVAGWAANWSAFRRLPEAVAGNRRLRSWLGAGRADWVGGQVARHFSGVAGYLALGFLLGFLPVLSVFAGLPVEVRHVTLNAASLALCAVQDAPDWPAIAWALAGILAIGVCNFTVAFSLSLRTALRARGLGGRERLGPWLWRRFLADPWLFLGPPKE